MPFEQSNPTEPHNESEEQRKQRDSMSKMGPRERKRPQESIEQRRMRSEKLAADQRAYREQLLTFQKKRDESMDITKLPPDMAAREAKVQENYNHLVRCIGIRLKGIWGNIQLAEQRLHNKWPWERWFTDDLDRSSINEDREYASKLNELLSRFQIDWGKTTNTYDREMLVNALCRVNPDGSLGGSLVSLTPDFTKLHAKYDATMQNLDYAETGLQWSQTALEIGASFAGPPGIAVALAPKYIVRICQNVGSDGTKDSMSAIGMDLVQDVIFAYIGGSGGAKIAKGVLSKMRPVAMKLAEKVSAAFKVASGEGWKKAAIKTAITDIAAAFRDAEIQHWIAEAKDALTGRDTNHSRVKSAAMNFGMRQGMKGILGLGAKIVNKYRGNPGESLNYRARSNDPEFQTYREAVMALPNTEAGNAERLDIAKKLFEMKGIAFTDDIANAILKTHNIGTPVLKNGQTTYEIPDLIAKQKELKKLIPDDDLRDALLRLGITGSIPPPPPPPPHGHGKKPAETTPAASQAPQGTPKTPAPFDRWAVNTEIRNALLQTTTGSVSGDFRITHVAANGKDVRVEQLLNGQPSGKFFWVEKSISNIKAVPPKLDTNNPTPSERRMLLEGGQYVERKNPKTGENELVAYKDLSPAEQARHAGYKVIHENPPSKPAAVPQAASNAPYKIPPPPRPPKEVMRKDVLEQVSLQDITPNKYNALMKKFVAPGAEFNMKNDLNNTLHAAEQGDYTGWTARYNQLMRGLQGNLSPKDAQKLQEFKKKLEEICPHPSTRPQVPNAPTKQTPSTPSALSSKPVVTPSIRSLEELSQILAQQKRIDPVGRRPVPDPENVQFEHGKAVWLVGETSKLSPGFARIVKDSSGKLFLAGSPKAAGLSNVEELTPRMRQQLAPVRNLQTEAVQRLDPSNGWKLHLNFDPNNMKAVQKIDSVLSEMKRTGVIVDYKIGHGGGIAAGQPGKEATVYIGHGLKVKPVSSYIENSLSKELLPPAGDVLHDDRVISPLIAGRFDLRDLTFNQYGSKGVPYVRDHVMQVAKKEMPAEDARKAADKILRERYGDFYSQGIDTP